MNEARYPDLEGKVAFVTGGSRGIGAETARLLAANGVRVAVNGRDEAALERVVSDIVEAGGQAISVPADCTDPGALGRAREAVTEAYGTPDILVAFAGAGSPISILDLTLEQWQSIVDTNLTATFLTVQTFLPGMVERGSGAIVTMSSSAGRLPSRASAAYAAAKAGIVMFTRHVANEVAPHGVRANCVAPDAILTERNAERIPLDMQRQVAEMHPIARMGTPRDVAQATAFLASDSSSWLTGLTVDIAGGKVMI
jgi:3-oxoacyl-[acyl-carrier protein] reductase